MAWARVAGIGTELKIDKRKKRPDGAEKLRLKKLKSLQNVGAGVNTLAGAAAPGDERVEAYMLSNVSLGLARLHFETCPKQSRKRFYIECDVT